MNLNLHLNFCLFIKFMVTFRDDDMEKKELESIKILALDIGDKYIGIAVKEPGMSIVFPRESVLREKGNEVEEILKIIEKESIDLLIYGIPYNNDGSFSKQAEINQDLVAVLKGKSSIKFDFINEYGSSREAKSRYRSLAKDYKLKKQNIDATSAVIILESYLNKF